MESHGDKGYYFAHWCGKGPFSLLVNGVQARVLHACGKKRIFTSATKLQKPVLLFSTLSHLPIGLQYEFHVGQ